MMLFAGAVLLLGICPFAASAQPDSPVPCEGLHLKVAGTGSAQCYSKLVQLENAKFLIEAIQVPVFDGILAVERERSASNRSIAQEYTLHGAADELGKFPRTEDWGPERRIEGYSVATFRGIAETWEGQCISLVRRAYALAGGYRDQVMGVYCTRSSAPVDDTTARDVLAAITVE